jgi:hypothetical protein
VYSVLYGQKFSTHLGKCQEAWWLEHVVRLLCVVRNCQTVSESGWTILQFSAVKTESQHLVLSILEFSLPKRYAVYLFVVLFYNFLDRYDAEYIFKGSFVICASSLVRYLFLPLPPFSLDYLLNFKSFFVHFEYKTINKYVLLKLFPSLLFVFSFNQSI